MMHVLRSFFLPPKVHRRRARPPSRYRPQLELLEDRLAPATLAILDNGDAGFSATPGFIPFSGQGYLDDVHYAEAGTGESATWTFTGLTPGVYRVAATWSDDPNRATDAPFTVFNGGTPLATVPVNQELVPDDFFEAGVTWKDLGTYTITAASLMAQLSNSADEYVIADAVRLERIEPGVLDNGQPGYSDTAGAWVQYAGQGYGGGLRFAAAGTGAHTATWTFAGLSAAPYTVQVTWTPHANRASNAPFQLIDGPSTVRLAVAVNQQLAPSGTLIAGAVFQTLGTVQVSSGTLRVVLSDNANGYVIADAVRLVPLASDFTNLPDYEVAPHAVTDAAGNLHLVYQGGPSGSWHVKYQLRPAGGNWQAPVDLGGVNAIDPKIAIDPAGGLHVVWFDQNEIFYRRRPAGSATWTAAQQLSGGAGSRSLECAVATDGLGRVHVVWHDEATGNWDVVYRRFEGGVWQPEERVSTRADADVFPRVAASANGTVHVVWHNQQTNQVYYRERAPGGGWSAVVRLDISTERSFNPDIVVDAAGIVHVAWHDNKAGDWDIAYVKRVGGVWTSPFYFLNAGATDADAHLAPNPDGTVSLIWHDYNHIYLVRSRAGGWTSPQKVVNDRGAKDNAIAVNPLTGQIHIIAQGRKTGVTAGGSWDLFYYTE